MARTLSVPVYQSVTLHLVLRLTVDRTGALTHSLRNQVTDSKCNMNTRLLFLPFTLLITVPAAAQDAPSPLSPLFECRQISNESARLACLDAAVDELYQSETSGEVVAVNRSDIEAVEEATYGLNIPEFRLPSLPNVSLPSLSARPSSDIADAAQAGDSESDSATSERRVVRNEEGDITGIEGLGIASLDRDAYDRLIITLQNGQVWRQIDDTRVLISRRQSPSDMTVAVRSAALASHQMQLNGRGRWFRVSREE